MAKKAKTKKSSRDVIGTAVRSMRALTGEDSDPSKPKRKKAPAKRKK